MTLPLPDLPSPARHAHIFPDLTNHLLISVGQSCDHGCEALFTSDQVVISKMENPLSQATDAHMAYRQHHLNLQPHSVHKPTLCMTTCLHPLTLSNFSMHLFSAQQLSCCSL